MAEERMTIEFHADDYAMFPAQSERIWRCVEEGKCNGISIMPNSSNLKQCMGDSVENANIKKAVHLNLVWGRALGTYKEVFLLVNKEGVFQISFGKLLLISYLPGIRKRYFDQISGEFRRQIRRMLPYLDSRKLRIDSHVHYHMIPVVFDALMNVLREESWQAEYIRIPKEDLWIYIRNRKKLNSIRGINLIKAVVLNGLALRARTKYRHEKALYGVLFSGVVLSGHMNKSNVEVLFPALKERARKKGITQIEILFHPGAVLEKEDILQLNSKGDRSFLCSKSRAAEADTLLQI